MQVWGGETTVRLPARPGRGGRAQHLALSAALALQGCDGGYLLAAGTDGSDGPGEDAGALVDVARQWRAANCTPVAPQSFWRGPMPEGFWKRAAT